MVWGGNCLGFGCGVGICGDVGEGGGIAGGTSDFDLLETVMWTPEAGVYLLERHVERLIASAEFLDDRLIRMS